MTQKEKVEQLSNMIYSTLPNLIGTKCVFLDLAYYINIGDILIWEGTEFFLKKAGIKCIYKASKDTYNPKRIPEGVTILLQGGGNFGDLWLSHQNFRLKVVANHPNNRIVILPQTIFYEKEEILQKHSDILSRHKDLYICARDFKSESLLKRKFADVKVLLLPDMAFCIPPVFLHDICKKKSSNKNLFLKRTDKELDLIDYSSYIGKDVDVHDWPTYEKNTLRMRVFNRLVLFQNYLRKNGLTTFFDYYCQYVIKPHMIHIGVRFISRYNDVYTTRLHAAILSLLLGKRVFFFDNSYGKNSSFFESWLSDVDNIKFLGNK